MDLTENYYSQKMEGFRSVFILEVFELYLLLLCSKNINAQTSGNLDVGFRSSDSNNQICNTSSGDVQGVCYTRTYCRLKSGEYRSSCSGSNRICCVFTKHCGDDTNEEVSYFEREVSFFRSIPQHCSYRVKKVSQEYCFLRIEPLEDDKHDAMNCANLFLTVSQLPENGHLPLCSNNTYEIDLGNKNRVTLRMNNKNSVDTNWKVKITQLRCSEHYRPTSVINNDNKEEDFLPVTPTTTATTTTTNPVFAQCGTVGESLEQTVTAAGKRNIDYQFGPRTWITPSTRIVRGLVAGRSEFPWQVALIIRRLPKCGGSIIGQYWILTAAHCVIHIRPRDIIIRLGDWDLYSTTDGPHVDVAVESIRTHPDFSDETYHNDIAIIQLKDKIQYTNNIRPVCLTETDLQMGNKQLKVSGWGYNEEGDTKLRKISTRLVSNESCNKTWASITNPKKFIYYGMMCLSSIFGDSCNGDSGGPVVYKWNGRYYQVGIVSFGSKIPCSSPGIPGVYTRVISYIQWIKNQLLELKKRL